MATTHLVSVEEYLRSSYEPDAEYVDGVIEERPMGEGKHSAWQTSISGFFWVRSDDWGIRVRAELRTQTGERRFRVPDVAILAAGTEHERIAVTPPLAAFEILSPEDRIARLITRLADFESMGVAGIYVVDPEDGSLLCFEQGRLAVVESISVAGRTVAWSEIAKALR